MKKILRLVVPWGLRNNQSRRSSVMDEEILTVNLTTAKGENVRSSDDGVARDSISFQSRGATHFYSYVTVKAVKPTILVGALTSLSTTQPRTVQPNSNSLSSNLVSPPTNRPTDQKKHDQ
jgi:hypothetical protein